MLVTELTHHAAQSPPRCLEALGQLLGRTERLPPEEMLFHQLRHLERLLRYAHEKVPYYRESATLRKLAELEPGRLRIEHFRELPTVDRPALQQHEQSLRSLAVEPQHAPLRGTSTSGSTGRPIKVDTSRVLTVLAAAQQERFHRWHGRDFAAKAAFITIPKAAGVADPPDGRKGRRWGLGGPCPSVELTLTARVSDQLEWLIRERPAYLVSYPSNVRALVRLSLDGKVALPGLLEVTVSSEPVSDELRRLVREAWGARLVSTYSANELGGIALEYGDSGEYAIQSEFLLVEILRPDGTPCEPGEVGKVVATALHNFHRPLIRYEVGDYAEVGHPPSGDVLLPRLARIMGRERNMVRLPGGDEVWPFFELGRLVELSALRQWQLVQRSERLIEARLVVDRPLEPAEEEVVRDVINACLPVTFEVALRYVNEIPRGPGGKYEEFINATEGTWKDPLLSPNL